MVSRRRTPDREPDDDATARFEAVRPGLLRLAYRMTGSRAEAEDILQDAWLRWQRTETGDVRNDKAFLSRTVARLAIDRTRSAAARREAYVGPWLPEPLPTAEIPASLDGGDPGAQLELAEDVSLALMMVLESLAPEERAAFLLREAFDLPYTELAATLNKSEDACRQMVSRARARLRERRPRFEASDEDHMRLLAAFSEAAQAGDAAAIAALLAPDVSIITDGGGKVSAALRVVTGATDVAKLVAHVATRVETAPGSIRLSRVNGRPGFVVGDPESPEMVYSIDVEAGRIATVYVMRNPEKLARLGDPPLGTA